MRYSFGVLRNLADVDVQDPYDNNMIIRFQTPEARGMITESKEAYFILHDSYDDNTRYRVHHATLGSDMPPSDIVIGLEYRGHSFQDVMRRVIDLTGIPYFETAMATRIGIIASGRTINLDGEKVFPNSYGLDRLFPTINQGLTGYVTFDFSSQVDVEWLMTYNRGEDSVTFVPKSPISLNTFLNGMAVGLTYPGPLPMEITASTTVRNFTLYGGREPSISIEVDYPNLSFYYGYITFTSYVVRYTISAAKALTVTVTGDVEIGGTNFRTNVGINQNAYMLTSTSTGSISIQQVIKHFETEVFGGLPLEESMDALPITSYSISQPSFSHTINADLEEISIEGNIDMRACKVHNMNIIVRRHYVRNLDYTNILIQRSECTMNLQTILGVTDGVDILTSEATVTMITSPIDLTNQNMPTFLSDYTRLYKGLSVVARQGFPKSCVDNFCSTLRSFLGQDYRFRLRSTIQDLNSFVIKDDINVSINIGTNAVLYDARLRINVEGRVPTAKVLGLIKIEDLNLILESTITNDARLITHLDTWNHPFGADYCTITDMNGDQTLNAAIVNIRLKGTFHLGEETCQSPLIALDGEIILDTTGENHSFSVRFAGATTMPSVICSMGIRESASTISWPTSDGNFIDGFTYSFSVTSGFHFRGDLNLACVVIDADVYYTGDNTRKVVHITSHLSQINNNNGLLIIDPLDDSIPLSMNGILFPAPMLTIHGLVKTLGISQPATLEISSNGYSVDIRDKTKPHSYYVDLHIYADPKECINKVSFKVRGRLGSGLIQEIEDQMKANQSVDDIFDVNDEKMFDCAEYDICDCSKEIVGQSCSSFKKAYTLYKNMKIQYGGEFMQLGHIIGGEGGGGNQEGHDYYSEIDVVTPIR